MRGKKAQFYLIVAIILVTIIIGFSTMVNYYQQKSSIRAYNLGVELGIEGGNVLDYGTLQGSEINSTELVENFTTLFDDYAGENVEIYFIYGDEFGITVYKYTKDGETKIKEIVESVIVDEIGKKILVEIEGIVYEFKLKPGENFYFIIFQEIGGEEYVITN